jgi:K+-transporting ATPase ATPase C chain
MVRHILAELAPAIRLTLVMALLTGVLYPLAVTGVAQAAFSRQANGSLLVVHGQVVGSSLIGQEFTSRRYFHGRPSATVSVRNPNQAQPYDAENSGGSNLGPSNPALIRQVAARVAVIRRQDGLGPDARVPVDLVTASASGLDPDISVAAALIQVPRVARARHLPPSRVRALVMSHVQGRILGLFGEPSVNVLELNLALDRISG